MRRPWNKTLTRLAMHLDVKDHQGQLGWVLYELAQPPRIDGGELDLPPIPLNDARTMTPAEYKTAVEYCGLSASGAAALHDTRIKTVQRWMNTGPVPNGTAAEIDRLQAQMDQSVQSSIAIWRSSGTESVMLYRYRANDYPQSKPAQEGLPHEAHNRLIGLVAAALRAEGAEVFIEYA